MRIFRTVPLPAMLLLFQFNTISAQPDFKTIYSSTQGSKVFTSYAHRKVSDGIVVFGEVSSNLSQNSKMMLMKLDNTGAVVWAKEITPGLYMRNFKLCVLNNGDIVTAENNPNSSAPVYSQIFLYRFTASGQPVWSKKLSLGPEAQGFANSYDLVHLQEGAGGDILLSTKKSSKIVITKINSTGDIGWSKTFEGDPLYQHDAQCFFINGRVVVYGLKRLQNYINNAGKYFFLMKLNYADGSVELKKDNYATEHPTGNYGVTVSNSNIHFTASPLPGDHFALTGLFSNFTSANFFFYKIIADSNFNILSSITYKLPTQSGSGGSYSSVVFPSGDVHFIGTNPDNFEGIYWYTVDSLNTFKRQMYLPYQPSDILMTYSITDGDNNGYCLLSSYRKASDQQPFISVANANDSDVIIKNCLGRDTALMGTRTWSFTNQTPWNWNTITDNEMADSNFSVTATDISVLAEQVCTGTLPLTLLQFKAALYNGAVSLLWKTASEINAHSIEVQRSTDGIHFSTITVLPAQKLPGINNYAWADNMIPSLAQQAFYRLKCIDNDGSYNMSQTLSINLDCKKKGIYIMPNPAHSFVKVVIPSDAPMPGRMTITDVLGRTVVARSVHLDAGINTITIDDLAGFTENIYRITITKSNGELLSAPLLVDHKQ